MREARIGVVGATGAVGAVTLALLAERGFENVRAFASARSAGSRMRFGDRELLVEEATPERLGRGDVDLFFFSVGTSASRELVPVAAASGERASECHFVGVLEIAAHGKPARESGHDDPVAEAVREVRGRSLSRHGRVRRQHDLLDTIRADAVEETFDPQVAGLDAVERRERAAEDVVEAAILVSPLEREHIDWLLDHADDRAVPARVGAHATELPLG